MTWAGMKNVQVSEDEVRRDKHDSRLKTQDYATDAFGTHVDEMACEGDAKICGSGSEVGELGRRSVKFLLMLAIGDNVVLPTIKDTAR